MSMTEGLDADEHPYCVPSLQSHPALHLPVVCGDRPSLQQSPGSTEQRGQGPGPGAHHQVQAQEQLKAMSRWAPSNPPQWEVGRGQEAPLQGDPGPHSPTCRLAENWKMAVIGAVNRPEARLKPDPRRKAPWAAGWRDSR